MKYLFFVFILLSVGGPAMQAQSLHWQKVNTIYGGTINCFGTCNGLLFAGGNADVYRWDSADSNWINLTQGISDVTVNCLASQDSFLFCGSTKGIFRTTDNGLNWTWVKSDFICKTISISKSVLAAADQAGPIYYSFDHGETWKESMLPESITGISTICQIGTVSVIGTFDSMCRTSDLGATWTNPSIGPAQYHRRPTAFAVIDSNIYAGCYDGVYVSNDSGINWHRIGKALIGVGYLATVGNTLYAQCEQGIVSFNNTDSVWTVIGTRMPNRFSKAFFCWDSTIITGTQNGAFFLAKDSLWKSIKKGIDHPVIQTTAVADGKLFIGLQVGGVYRSIDNGISWTFCGIDTTEINNIFVVDSIVFVATNYTGFFRSEDYGIHWTKVLFDGSDGSEIYEITSSGSSLFAVSSNPGILRSDDLGLSWKSEGQKLTSQIANINGILFVIRNSTTCTILRSTNNGEWWTESKPFPTFTHITDFVYVDSMIIVSSESNGCFQSTNFGLTWKAISSTTSAGYNCLLATDRFLFAGAWFDGGVYVSKDTAHSWVRTDNTMSEVYSLARVSDTLFAGTKGGLFYTDISKLNATVSAPTYQLPQVQIFPNPANENIAVQLDSVRGKIEIRLINAIGNSCLEEQHLVSEYRSNCVNLHTDNLPSGDYLLSIKTDSGVTTKKVSIVR